MKNNNSKLINFATGQQLLDLCQQNGWSLSEATLQRELLLFDSPLNIVRSTMEDYYQVMKQSVRTALEETPRSMGGLLQGQAAQIYRHHQDNPQRSATGGMTSRAIAYAMGVLEVNASMGLIVAAPTGGSCGVIPGAFLALQEEYALSDNDMVDGLFCASGVGYLIMKQASVSGAECGCQAEIGSASAMAAAGLTEILGGSPEQCLHSAAFALSNVMGLVCDPVAGLVEVPCHSRNGIGASNAMISAEIALSGVSSPVPFDEVVEAMYRVGRSMPLELRETALGGIATTPTGCQFAREFFGE